MTPENGEMYKPNGELQGDTKPMPDRGTTTGVTDTYGADVSQDATNRIGSIRGATRSDGQEPA
jgi:hypothetical protein